MKKIPYMLIVGEKEEEIEAVREKVLLVARKVVDLKFPYTLRGKVGDFSITMYNDAKNFKQTYYWKDND